MVGSRTVLVVSPTPSLAAAIASSVGRSGNVTVLVRSFAEAKKQLQTAVPQLLITELKLDAFNGLQLALRAVEFEIPVIVIADRGYEQDIEQVGALWIAPEAISGETLAEMTTQLLEGTEASTTAFGWYDDDAITRGAAIFPWPARPSELRH